MRFWPSGVFLPGKNLGEICGRIAPRFWPPGILLPGENVIPAKSHALGVSLTPAG